METKEFFAKLGKHCREEHGYCKGCAFREFCCKTAGEIDDRKVALAEKLLTQTDKAS